MRRRCSQLRSSWLLALAAARVLELAAARCAPLEDRQWVFAFAHKTGTVLVQSVVHEVVGIDLHHFTAWVPDDETPSGVYWTKVVNAIATPESSHLLPASVPAIRSEVEQMVAWAQPKALKISIFVRDPIEVVLSGYFYHRTTTERFVHVPMHVDGSYQYKAVYAHCRGRTPPPDDDDADLARAAACAEVAYRERNATYQELVLGVEPRLGIFVEAQRTLGVVAGLNLTVHALRGLGDTARVYDLDAVTATSATFDAAFRDMFAFMGAEDVDDCVDLASIHDLHRSTASLHALPASMSAARHELRAILLNSTWFARNIQPYRVDMGYAAPDDLPSP